MNRLLPRFTVTTLQAVTYLLGIALFSISFLVFLNSSISFVVTDVIGQKHGVGDAVGTLGFADELLALVACPLWGLVSDRLGVRTVAATGYIIIALSLICLVQSKRVYPDLLIFRLLFSLGGAACSTMVTAILPAMTAKREEPVSSEIAEEASSTAPTPQTRSNSNSNRHSMAFSISSELTITPARYVSQSPQRRMQPRRSVSGPQQEPVTKIEQDLGSNTNRLAGFVGMFTGIGALLAVAVFLPLPTTLSQGRSRAMAVQGSFYIVAAVSFLVACFVFIGLRNLPGEEHKGIRRLFNPNSTPEPKEDEPNTAPSTPSSAPASVSYTHLTLPTKRIV